MAANEQVAEVILLCLVKGERGSQRSDLGRGAASLSRSVCVFACLRQIRTVLGAPAILTREGSGAAEAQEVRG